MSFQFGKFSDKAVQSILESTASINIWEGSVRSGKTISSIVRWIEYVKTAPSGKLVMIGKTERTLKRNILDLLTDIVGEKNFKYNRGLGEATLYGRIIDIVGANDERAESKIRGATYAGAYCDEITLYPESFFKMLRTRFSVLGAKLFGTTNPDSPFHWFKTGYIDRQEEIDIKVFHFTLDDNQNNPAEYIENLKKEYTGLWYQRFILGLWVLAEGVIYSCFNSNKHVIKKKDLPEKFDREFITIDYGTNNPCVFLHVGVKAGIYYVIKEYYWNGKEKGQKTNGQYAKDLKLFMEGTNARIVIIDPSALSFKTELRQLGIATTDAENEVLEGIRVTSTFLNNDKILIVDSCINLIKEFGNYVWDEKAAKRGEDKPIKAFDHALDALRYLIYTLHHKPGFVAWKF